MSVQGQKKVDGPSQEEIAGFLFLHNFFYPDSKYSGPYIAVPGALSTVFICFLFLLNSPVQNLLSSTTNTSLDTHRKKNFSAIWAFLRIVKLAEEIKHLSHHFRMPKFPIKSKLNKNFIIEATKM